MPYKGKVLMLGAGPLQVGAIEAAKNAGFEVLCADYDPEAVGFKVCDRHFLVSTVDAEAVLRLAKEENVDFVITSTSDAPVRTAAYVSERLGLPTGISYVDSICATQKDAMRERLAARDVPIPEFRACGDYEAFLEAIRELGPDCVIKPADSAASRGVRLLDQEYPREDLPTLFEKTLSFSRKGVVMVEERLYGPEVSVEAITVGGKTSILAITDKLVTEPPYRVELGHSEPSLLPADTQAAIKRVALDTIAAIGIVNGPSHTEIKVTESGPKVIEIAARLGGDFITSKLVPLSTGVNLVDVSVRFALGLEAGIARTKSAGATIRFITADHQGVIDDIAVDEELMSVKGFEEIELYAKTGDSISSPHSSNDRIGHVICVGRNAEEAMHNVERALSKVSVSIA